MPSKEITLTDREQEFIYYLLETGGKITKAAELAGYSHPQVYGYKLRDRLAKYITEAAQQYCAMNSVRAAKHIVDQLDEDMPNPVKLNAAKDILDRAGVRVKEEAVAQITIKPNIFILPEKRIIEDMKIIDNDL